MVDNPGLVSDETPVQSLKRRGSLGSANLLPIQHPKLRWWNYVTMEPLVACYFVSFSLMHLVSQNLMLQKACWPGEIQPELNATCQDEKGAQTAVADINIWKPIIQFSLPLAFVLFAGSWSDNHGGRRKPLLLLPVFGELLTDLALMLNVYFWNWPLTAAAIAEALPSALCGGRGMITIGVTSYIADVTSHKTRTVRMGIVTALVFVGTPVGTALGGVLNRVIGFMGVFAVCASLNALGLIYTAFCVKETGTHDVTSKKAKLFDVTVVIQCVKTVLKPREGYRRSCIIMLAIATFFVMGPFMGEFSVLYLFVRVKFGWNEVDFGFYAAYKMTVVLGGTIFSVGLLSYYLKMDDSMIGLIACILQAVASLIYVFIKAGWLMYVVPLIELMHGAALTVQRSSVSKLVSNSEMAQTNAILGVVESIVPLVVFPLYNSLYLNTLDVLPSAFYLLGAGLTVPAIIIFSVVYKLTKIQDKQERMMQENSSSKCSDIVQVFSIKSGNKTMLGS